MATQNAERQHRNESENASNRSYPACQESTGEDFYDLVSDVSKSCQKYCMHRPRVVAGVILSAGFILGWKMRPW